MMDMMDIEFDSTHRARIVEDLHTTSRLKMHVVKLLIEDVEPTIKVGAETGKTLKTNIGTGGLHQSYIFHTRLG